MNHNNWKIWWVFCFFCTLHMGKKKLRTQQSGTYENLQLSHQGRHCRKSKKSFHPCQNVALSNFDSLCQMKKMIIPKNVMMRPDPFENDLESHMVTSPKLIIRLVRLLIFRQFVCFLTVPHTLGRHPGWHFRSQCCRKHLRRQHANRQHPISTPSPVGGAPVTTLRTAKYIKLKYNLMAKICKNGGANATQNQKQKKQGTTQLQFKTLVFGIWAKTQREDFGRLWLTKNFFGLHERSLKDLQWPAGRLFFKNRKLPNGDHFLVCTDALTIRWRHSAGRRHAK